jgi:ABC-type lipoprotein release transport system permease subunit
MWCAPTRDLVTLIVTVAVLAAVALVASVIPTQRATRPEPTSALRID